MKVTKGRAPGIGPEWLRQQGPGHPMVLFCRATLSRNIEGMPFPTSANEEDLERSRGMVLEAVSKRLSPDRDWEVMFAEELSREELELLAEEYITGAQFAERPAGRALAVHWKDARTVTVNTGDHLRLQAVLPGGRFIDAWKDADKLDRGLEAELKYSFDHKLGYLTASPSDVGTGLRLSAMLHLPALVISGEIARTVAALGQAGMYVSGLYGEGTGLAGNLIQVSNRSTLGKSEEGIASHLELAVRQIADKERTARKMMMREAELELADRVLRALGIVERARRLHYYEALELLSLLKLGVETDILQISDFSIMEVGVNIGPYHTRRPLGVEAGEEEVDRERAAHMRRLLGI